MSIDLNQFGFGFDIRELLGGDYGEWGWPVGGYIPPTYRDYTKRGEALSLYLDPYQLKYVRDRSRSLCTSNEFAICAIDNIKNFTIGKGFEYRCVPIGDDKSLAEEVTEFIKLFSEANDLAERELETSERCDVDGEAFIRLFPRSDGMTYIRFVEPELVKAPSGDAEPKYSFGVQTAADDIETIEGYWIIDDPLSKYQPRFVDEAEIVHLKLNTRSTAKRGLPTFFPIDTNLRRAEQLLANMSSMAKIRAAIAMIRHMTGTQKTTAQSLVSQQTTEVTGTDPMTGATLNVERYRPGTVLTAPATMEYEFPHAGVAASEFVEVLQAELRACAARLNMPEWMFSVDASNASFSSSFVAESASVKMFEARQAIYKRKWGEGRYGQKKSVIWRVLENAIAAGLFPEDLGNRVRIIVEPCSLLARDKDREASTNKLYYDMKVKSRRQIQQELGLDGEQMDRDFAEDPVAQAMDAQAQADAQADGGSPEQKKQPVQQQWQAPQTRLAVARNFTNMGESLALPDVRQEDDYSCGAAVAMAIGSYYKVGPETLHEWKHALGTEIDGCTRPEAIVQCLGELGLVAEGREQSTLADLKAAIHEKRPVIALIDNDGVGHYVAVIGESLGSLIIHDPITGHQVVKEEQFLAQWHDEGFEKYAIFVGTEEEMNRKEMARLNDNFEKLLAALGDRRVLPESTALVQSPGEMHYHLPGNDFEKLGEQLAKALANLQPPTIKVEPKIEVEVPQAAPPTVVCEPKINVEAPVVQHQTTVQAAPATVTVIQDSGERDHEIVRGDDGKIAGLRTRKAD